jgi:cytochrome b6-f complex iron-sulfur subunit
MERRMIIRDDAAVDHPAPTQPMTSRREFLRCSCSAGMLLALGTSLAGCADPTGSDSDPGPGGGATSGVTITSSTVTLDLAHPSLERLRASGGFLFVPAASIIAINAAGTIRAFTSVCTHQGFAVDRFAGGRMICSGHGSEFNPDGTVASGQAPLALREFGVTRSGDTVTVQRG